LWTITVGRIPRYREVEKEESASERRERQRGERQIEREILRRGEIRLGGALAACAKETLKKNGNQIGREKLRRDAYTRTHKPAVIFLILLD
jgi:hypothetical protein